MITVTRLFEERSACFDRFFKTLKESDLVGDIEETPIDKRLTRVTITIDSKDLYMVKQTFPDAEMIPNIQN